MIHLCIYWSTVYDVYASYPYIHPLLVALSVSISINTLARLLTIL